MRLRFPVPPRFPLRLHFQETPWDLAVVIAYTLIVSAILLVLGVGNVLAILLVLLTPGYVLVALLFPTDAEFDWIERLTLSFGVSLVIVALLGLLLAVSPIGLQFVTVDAAIVAFTGFVGLAAYERRVRIPVEQRLAGSLDISLPEWKGQSSVDKILTLAIAASIIAAAGAVVYVVVTPRVGERFTEFYLLGPGGNVTGLPTNLSVSEPATVIVGLANHEAATMNYSVRIDLVGIAIVHNGTSGYNEVVELNRTTLRWFNTTLPDGATWTQRYTFSISAVGEWEIQFLLYKRGALTTDELRLILAVT